LHPFITIKTKAMAIIKVIEILSNSEKSWEDAAQKAILEASKTIKNLRSIYIKDHSATIDKNNKIEEYRITANLSFEIEGPEKSVSKK
jgi:flavin-binding protein dodecin